MLGDGPVVARRGVDSAHKEGTHYADSINVDVAYPTCALPIHLTHCRQTFDLGSRYANIRVRDFPSPESQISVSRDTIFFNGKSTFSAVAQVRELNLFFARDPARARPLCGGARVHLDDVMELEDVVTVGAPRQVPTCVSGEVCHCGPHDGCFIFLDPEACSCLRFEPASD